MQTSDSFTSDDTGRIFQKASAKPVRQTVIKSTKVQVGKPKKIDQYSSSQSHDHGGSIFPLIEGDEIVGFVYECSCGEVAKIIFDYEKNVGRVAS